MKSLSQILEATELRRFLLIGVANTLLCYAAYLLVLAVATRQLAFTVAFLAGICFTTVANVRFAFMRKLTPPSIIVYAIYYCLYWLASLSLLELAVRGLGVPEVIGPIVVLPFSVPPHYLLSRIVLSRFHAVSERGETARMQLNDEHPK